MTHNAIVPFDARGAVENVKQLRLAVDILRQSGELVPGVDYGKIPGTGDKDTLLLPGMEKLCRALNAIPEYREIYVERDYDKPRFHFEYECTLRDVDTGLPISGGRGIGSCNSEESGFKWRWVQAFEVPADYPLDNLIKRGGKTSEFEFAINKAETTGKYGKPAEYWQAFKSAIAAGTAVGGTRETARGMSPTWEIDTTVYRIPNPDIFDQINGIMKRAKKRALGDAIKGAANVSAYFTVDMEDFVPGTAVNPDGDIVDGTFTETHFEEAADKFAQDFPANPETMATPGALWNETKSYFHARTHFDNFGKKHADALKGKTLAEAIEYVKEKHWNWEVGRVETFKQFALSQYEMTGDDVKDALKQACGHSIAKWTDWDGGSVDVAHGALLAWFAGYDAANADELGANKGLSAAVTEAAKAFCTSYQGEEIQQVSN